MSNTEYIQILKIAFVIAMLLNIALWYKVGCQMEKIEKLQKIIDNINLM